VARFQLEAGPVPLHHQVYLDLRSALDAEEWRPGDRLPPERELAERYGCSLITVRRALSELSREQRLERTRGRGTFVLRPRIDRDLAGTMSFTEEMQTRGLDPSTRLVNARREKAGEQVAQALSLEVGAPTLYLERLRIAGGEPLLLEEVHLPADRFPGLLASDLEKNSLYDLLTQRYATRISRLRETLEPVLLPHREARLLERPPRSLALLIEGTAFTTDGTPVEFGRTYVRGDRTRYYVERVVVRSSWGVSVDESLTATGAGGNGRSGPAPDGRRASGQRGEERRRPIAGKSSTS
jgi:GntR family transcriptional regulator